MPNIPPDLKDEIAIRNYLSRMSNLPAVPGYAGIQSSTANLFKLPVLTDTSLSEYVKGLVKEFDDSLRATIDEVDNALRDINSQLEDDGTMLIKVENSINTTGSGLNASISTVSLAAVSESGDFATSQSVTTLDSRVTNVETNLTTNYATVTQIASTYATQDEVGAIYGVNVEANGHVSGYKSIATGTSSIFQIYAEKFAVSSSSTGEGYSPFQIDTVNHKINMTSDVAIDGNLLVTGTIVGAKIAASTITAAKIAASTITANEIAASTITGNKIAAATITTSNLATNILLVNAYIQSSNYSWNGGAPVGFGMWSTGDPTSGQAYNIIGGKIFGGTITGTTINAGDLIASKQRVDGLRVYNSSYPNNTAPNTIVKGSSYTFPDKYKGTYVQNLVFYGASYRTGFRADRFVNEPTSFLVTVSCSVNQALWADSYDYYTITLSGTSITPQVAIIGVHNRTVSMSVVVSVAQAASATFTLTVVTTGNSCEPMTASISAIGFNS